jgi:glycosyltransferase involved in cell wall biosynthesis
MQLSVIIPCFNEEKTIEKIVCKVDKALKSELLNYEIIVIDDGSTDKSLEIISKIEIPIVYSTQINKGKGRAVQNGIKMAKGIYVIVQDADLEYEPRDIVTLYKKADINQAVYGSRMLDENEKYYVPKNYALTSTIANIFFTILHFILYKSIITDTLTGYKLYPRIFFEKVIKMIMCGSYYF